MTLDISEVIEKITEELDIPPSYYKLAAERYDGVGKHLDADPKLNLFRPKIYPQGSFRLGTAIKPIVDGDEYDVDLVCELNLKKSSVTPAGLKKLIGDSLKSSPNYAKLLKDDDGGKRCWTLQYKNEFHLDILPAIPMGQPPSYLGVNPELLKHAIDISDKHEGWKESNPEGYALWFEDRQKVIYQAGLKRFAESQRYAKVDDIPSFERYRIKTPLRQAVKLLKRHRDIAFEKEQELKPISIIITTLAARAYNGQPDTSSALAGILADMPQHIKLMSGAPWVENPTRPAENFAEKWEKDSRLMKKFDEWRIQAQRDFKDIGTSKLLESQKIMKRAFGDTLVTNAIKRLGTSLNDVKQSGNLKVSSTGVLGAVGTAVFKNTNYGE